MLGASLVKFLSKKYDVYGTSKTLSYSMPSKKFMEFDLIKNSYEPLINWSKPDTIIHCAANTNLDKCEKNPELAYKTNSDPIKKFLTSMGDCRFIFISSDAVFDDNKLSPNEKDKTNPLNVYGMSKKLAEDYLLQSKSNYLIIRTTIVGKNLNRTKTSFVDWIIKSLIQKKHIKLFDDVLFSPITIWCLCNEIDWILENDVSGVFHIAGVETVSKFNFGKALCNAMKLDKTLIHRASIEDINFHANRQRNQTIDSSNYQEIHSRSLPRLTDTIKDLVKNINLN